MFIKSSSNEMRLHIVKLMHRVSLLIVMLELFILTLDYFTNTLENGVIGYSFLFIFLPAIWNFTMCFLLTFVNKSNKFNDAQKTSWTIFLITKICACIAIVHAYYLPTQCAFVVAIIIAAMISDTKKIIETTLDSVAMLILAVMFSPIFNPSMEFKRICESAIMSGVMLLFIGTLAHVISKHRQTNDKLIQKYMVELEKATHNAKLDMMTGLYHHAEFYNILYSLISKAGNKLSVAIMDIDNFKSINDTYGHDNGDKVILAIANYVRKMNNDSTVFASRYGGEEFAFIFINTPKSKVIDDLQTLRANISGLVFDFDENKKITMSGGVFECDACTYAVENVFNNADTALYYAKEHGRNQLIVYEDIVNDEKSESNSKASLY